MRRARAARSRLPLATGSLLVLAACGSKQDTISPPAAKPFTVVLDFFPNADHAALYAAIAHGDFRAAGLDVQPQTPADPSEPLKLLAAGKADMAISYEPELLLARDQGLKLVSIGALVQRPLTSIIALPQAHVKKVARPRRQDGRHGRDPLPGGRAEDRAAGGRRRPASVKEVNVGFNLVPAMLSGKVAATLGGFWNYEAMQLQQLHKHPLDDPRRSRRRADV